MLRSPHAKACLNQLRLVLKVTHEQTLCSRSSSSRRGEQHKLFCSAAALAPVSRAFSDALDSSGHVSATRICTRFLSTHMNWLHMSNAFLRFLHTAPSQSPPNRSKYSSPESRCSTNSILRTAALQTCGLHRSAVTDECLSAGNEVRCRRSLQANAALYARDDKSWAAVLVCLCAVSGDPALLFTLRSAKLKGRHKGDVSFAGGKKDPSDRTVVDTALREAREELGVHVTEDKVWGVLKPVQDRSGMMIAPVIANLGPLEALSFRPNPSEVDEIFTLTLEHLCQPQNQGYTNFRLGDRYGCTLPVFLSPEHRIWGLTAVALHHTLKLIMPQEQQLAHNIVQWQLQKADIP